MGTRGTVNSNSYPIEIGHFFPEVKVYQQACPMWVPLVENNEHLAGGADYFVNKYVAELLQQSEQIDCILLACTHYPLLVPKLKAFLPTHIKLLSQGDIVAKSLADYLSRHTEIETSLGKEGKRSFYTSGDVNIFNKQASVFLGQELLASQVKLS